MNDLFGEDTHDAGGKVRIPLRPGVVGDAFFHDERNCRRITLSRHMLGFETAPYALFCGMNPSTAGAFWDDPTVLREWIYTTEQLKLKRYIKVNVLDYCLTESKDLAALNFPLSSPRNLETILDLAGRAQIVVMACGVLPKKVRAQAVYTISALRDARVPLWCLGTTRDGWPKHPLYLKRDTPLERFK